MKKDPNRENSAIHSDIKLWFCHVEQAPEVVGLYESALKDCGSVTSEEHYPPAAGTGALEVAVVIKFLATAIAGGVVYDCLKKIGSKLYKLSLGRSTKGRIKIPQLGTVAIDLAGVEVILGRDDFADTDRPEEFEMHPRVLESLGEVFQTVVQHLEAPPLSETDFNFLCVPVLAAQEQANNELVKRFWQPNKERPFPYKTGTYYDSVNHLMIRIA